MDKLSLDAALLSGDEQAARGTLTVKSDPEQEKHYDSQSPPLSQYEECDEEEEEAEYTTHEDVGEDTTQEADLPYGGANVAQESPHRVEKACADEGREANARGPAPPKGGHVTHSSADQKMEFVVMTGGVRPVGTVDDQPLR
jgi:hypothetical protein